MVRSAGRERSVSHEIRERSSGVGPTRASRMTVTPKRFFLFRQYFSIKGLHFLRTCWGTLAYPYPGRSTRQMDPLIK